MLQKIYNWFREDPFGPEMFGLIVEIVLIGIVARIFLSIWKHFRASAKLNDAGADLAAKMSRVRDAALEIVRMVQHTIKQADLLQTKYGVSTQELQALLRDLSGDQPAPRELTQVERDALREVRDRYVDEAFNFREAADRIAIIFDALEIQHNLTEIGALTAQVENSIRTIHRYSVRDNLISDFEADALPTIDRLLSMQVTIGKRSFKTRRNSDG